MKIAGAILAGGQAKRLHGIAKGNIRINNNTIIANLINSFNDAGITDIAISANNSEPYKQYDKTIIADFKLDSGPLAGISAVLEYYQDYDAVIFMPCDLPFITTDEIVQLKKNISSNIVYAKTPTRSHPLCVAIPTNMMAVIADSLNKNNLKIIEIWKQLNAELIKFEDENKFHNINTPTLLWVITGSRRGAGKTTLAHKLLEILPHSIYAKYGHGKFNPNKQKNFFDDLEKLHDFIAQNKYLKQNIIIEANALALADIGDITIFIDAPETAIKLRRDAELLKSKADIILSTDSGHKIWDATLPQLPEIIQTAVIKILLQHQEFISFANCHTS